MASAVLAEGASAETWCAPAPCGEGTAVATINDAVDAADADPGPDDVAIQPGTHETPLEGCGGLFVSGPDTTVRGAGVGETILTFPPLEPDDGFSRRVICGHMHLRDMTLRLPSAITPTHNSSVDGFDLYSGSIRNVRVDAVGAEFGPGINDGQGFGGLVRGGVIENVEVRLGLRQDTEGISLIGLPNARNLDITARDSGLFTRVQQEPGNPPQRIRDIVVRSRQPLGVLNESDLNSQLLLSDAVLDTSRVRRGVETSGLTVINGLPPERIRLRMDRVTIVGNRSRNSAAMGVVGQGQPFPTVLRGRHVIATGFDDTLSFGLFGGDAKAVLKYSNLSLRPRDISREGDDGRVIKHFGPGNRSGNPRFIDSQHGDYRLRASSPAVDIGGAPFVGGGPTPEDGDGNGSARRDAGAFERHG
jgi:hypothetical protein